MSIASRGGTTALNYGYALFTGWIVLHFLKRKLVQLAHKDSGSTFLRHSLLYDGRPPSDKMNDSDFKKHKKIYVPKDGSWTFVAQIYDIPYSEGGKARLIDWMISEKPRAVQFTLDVTQPIQPQVDYFTFLTDCIFFPGLAHKKYPDIINALPKQWKFLNHKYTPKKLAFVVNKGDFISDRNLELIMRNFTVNTYMEHDVKGHYYDLLSIWGRNKVEVETSNDKPFYRTKLDSGRLLDKTGFMKFVNPN